MQVNCTKKKPNKQARNHPMKQDATEFQRGLFPPNSLVTTYTCPNCGLYVSTSVDAASDV